MSRQELSSVDTNIETHKSSGRFGKKYRHLFSFKYFSPSGEAVKNCNYAT
jgi:hypothetical protein